MIYRIVFFSDEVDNFKLTFDCDPYATFKDLHDGILAATGYPNDQMTSFFMCNHKWEREQEVTLMEMESSFEYDNMVMDETHLDELLTEPKQHLIYVFDPMLDRYFSGTLAGVIPGENVNGVVCTEKAGKAPKQLQEDDLLSGIGSTSGDLELDDDFFGSTSYNPEEMDEEGFGDLSWDNNELY